MRGSFFLSSIMSHVFLMFQWLFRCVGLRVVHSRQWRQDSSGQAVLCPAERVFRGHCWCKESLCRRPGDHGWVNSSPNRRTSVRMWRTGASLCSFVEYFPFKWRLATCDPFLLPAHSPDEEVASLNMIKSAPVGPVAGGIMGCIMVLVLAVYAYRHQIHRRSHQHMSPLAAQGGCDLRHVCDITEVMSFNQISIKYSWRNQTF